MTDLPPFKDTIYLHIRPRRNGYDRKAIGMSVKKLARSLDAEVTPGDYIVKLDVVAPRTFFEDAMPSARIEITPGQVVPVIVEAAPEGDI